MRSPIACMLAGILLVCACSDRPEGAIVLRTARFPDDSLLRELLDRFEEENPGISVRHESLPNASDVQHQFYVVNLASGSTDFDVFSMDVVWGPEFARAGWTLDLSEYAEGLDLDDFFEGPMNAVRYSDRLVALPWYMDSGLLYYRSDLLEMHGIAPPSTYDELKVAAAAILEAEDDPSLSGFIYQGKQYEGLVCATLEAIWGNGGRVIGPDGRAAIASPQAVEALAFMRGMIEAGDTPDFVTTFDEEAARNSFGNGRAIFMRNWPYCWGLYQQEGSQVRGKVGYTLVPHFEGHESSGALGGWQLGVNPASRNKDAAWKLVRYLTGPDAQREMAVRLGFSPSRRSVYDDPSVIESRPFIAGLRDVMEQARPRPVTPHYPSISQVLQSAFSTVLAGRAPPERALGDAAEKIDAILER